MSSPDPGAELAAALAQLTTAVRVGANEVVADHTARLEAAVKRHASQPRTRPRPLPSPMRPEGPRLLTGSYVRSIGRQVDQGALQATGSVGTNDVRAMPLEHGSRNLFGRGIRMRAYPHWGPALDEVEPGFLAAMAAVPVVAAEATRSGRIRSLLGRLFGRRSA